jgi:MFS family permease
VVDTTTTATATKPRIALGLRENWQQFTLLVLINAFVGGMVGLERTLVRLIGSEIFQLASTVAVTSFIISFGVVKAITNLVSGQLADTCGRKKTLVLGWAVGLPVPFLIMWAPTWEWIVAANVLLGINQGLSWSMTVIMKVDLVGPRQRGLAVGLNEFAGYLAVGLTAFLTGYLATLYGLRPVPFYLGIGYAAAGFLLSAWVVRDTRGHVALERSQHPRIESSLSFRDVFLRTSLTDRNLFAASQAGLVNNLNDGMSWGIFPLFFAAAGLSIERIGILKGVYPALWGVLQVVTGPLSDWGRKGLISTGMWVQAIGLLVIAGLYGFGWWLLGSILLGVGTAMVYPCLLAAVSDAADPSWRARALSVYRFWRDLGYAIGALTAGLLVAIVGFAWTIAMIGMLTFISGLIVAALMKEQPR